MPLIVDVSTLMGEAQSDSGWDCTRGPARDDRLAVFEADDLDGAGAEEFFEGVRSDPGSVLDLAALLATRLVRLIEVHEY